MNKKISTVLSILLVAALMLAACAPKEEAAPVVEEPAVVEPAVEEPVVEEPAATEEPAVEEPAAPVATIRIWADDTRSAILSELADDFLAAYNVEVVVEEVADIRDQFTVAAPSGEGPDIIIILHDQAGSLVESGLLAPIDLGDKADAFIDVAITGFTFDGVLFGMPYATENLAFFYNTDLVPEPPSTWDEVVAVGTALQAEGKATFGLGMSGTTYDIFPLMTAKGGYIFGQDDNGNWNPQDVGLDSAGMIAAGDWVTEQVAAGFVSDSTDWDTAHALFETGEVPFIMAGPWALDRIRAAGVPYAITNFPDSGRPFAGVQGFVVNALSENVLLAQAFLTEFVATDDVMTQLYQAGNRPSAFVSVLEATADADLLAFGLAGADAMLMPAIPEMGSVWGSWGDAFSLIFTGQQTAEEALTNGAAQVRALIAGTAAGMVNVLGSWQVAAGCPGDWQPDCDVTALTEGDDGLYTGTFELVAGDYEAKVALDGAWTTNYGVDGVQDGDNYAFSMAADGKVTFTYDSETHVLTIVTE